MHSIYTTTGFVIGSRFYGEADKILSLFTRDFGLVSVIAKGIRLEKSKLRYFAQDYSMSNFSLVRGRDFWRLTSAQDNFYAKQSLIKSGAVARISLLLKRLLQGEESHPELFAHIESLIIFLASNANLSTEELDALESLIVFRLLKDLGYIGDDAKLASFVEPKNITGAILREVLTRKVILNQHINKALKESHL